MTTCKQPVTCSQIDALLNHLDDKDLEWNHMLRISDIFGGLIAMIKICINKQENMNWMQQKQLIQLLTEIKSDKKSVSETKCIDKDIFHRSNAMLLVDGSIREFQHKYNDTIYIPSDINAICFSFYFQMMDPFDIDKTSKHIEISSDRLSIIRRTILPFSNTAYGKRIISTYNNNCIYCWTFRVIQRTHLYCIGITKCDHGINKVIDDDLINGSSNCYFYNGFNGGLVKRDGVGLKTLDWINEGGPSLEENDIFKQILDVNDGELSFYVNGAEVRRSNQDMAFRNIVKGKNIFYRMAVALHDHRDAIQLIEFSKTNT